DFRWSFLGQVFHHEANAIGLTSLVSLRVNAEQPAGGASAGRDGQLHATVRMNDEDGSPRDLGRPNTVGLHLHGRGVEERVFEPRYLLCRELPSYKAGKALHPQTHGR